MVYKILSNPISKQTKYIENLLKIFPKLNHIKKKRKMCRWWKDLNVNPAYVF